jgi:hypothetical protein
MRIGTKTSGLAAAAALISVGIAAPAFAADSISVAVPAKTLANKLTADTNVSSDPIAVSVSAGQYSVVMGSLDDVHPNQVEQPNERWYAVFYGADGAVVGTTSTTPDLALADISREWDAAPLSLTANATSVVYFHAAFCGGLHSLSGRPFQKRPRPQQQHSPPGLTQRAQRPRLKSFRKPRRNPHQRSLPNQRPTSLLWR